MQAMRWILLVALSLCVANAHAETTMADDAELDRVVHDVCSRDVVLLGEDNHHGSGATMEVKAQLIHRLVGHCGFDQVLFESGFDEFVGFNRTLAAGGATQAQLADAVGGVWSGAAETQSLLAWLFDAAKAGKVQVGGIDPQSQTATGRWTWRELGDTLAPFVPRGMRIECKGLIDRNEAWTYDDAHPYDDAEQARLNDCAARMSVTLAERANVHDEATEMARNWVAFMQMQSGQDAIAGSNLRDRRMFDLLDWHRAHGKHKTIVWCASVHAAKSLDGPRIPTGKYLHDEFGERAAVIGFTAVAGSYGGRLNGWKVVSLPAPQVGSIEAIAAPTSPAQLRYLDAAALKDYGNISARALDYTKPQAEDWSKVFDGLIVLREERAQAPADARQ